jgi:phosphoglycolate phosphatase
LGLEKNLIIFDLDGTLVDSANQIISSVQSARKQLNFVPAESDFLYSKIGLPARHLFSDLILSENEVTNLVEAFRANLKNTILNQNDVFTDVPELLALLQRIGYQISVATNKPSDLARQALESSGLLELVDFVIGSEKLPPKPDPAILETCLSHFKVQPSQAVMIGDRREDMMAAKSANVLGVGITQGIHNPAQLKDAGAAQVFNDISEILTHMKKGWNFEDLQ